MTRLATLRSQLAALRRARAAVRSATAWSAAATAVLWALAGVLALDVLFELELLPRAVVLAIAAGAVLWAFWKYTRPLLGHAESEIDVALLVEREQQIDSDLVAALQFESPGAKAWGSTQLEAAVIDYVAAVGRGINVFAGFSRAQMVRRTATLGITLVVLLALAAIFPGHAAAFFNRLLLGSLHYPSRTRIKQIFINRQSVLDANLDGSQPRRTKAAQGRPLTFYVATTGSLPEKGTVELRSTSASRTRTRIELRPMTATEMQQLPLSRRGEPRHTFFTGKLPRLLENVSYQVRLGDGWTDRATIEMVPLPAAEPRLTPFPPKYARVGKESFDPTGRQVSVLEGTTIRLALHSTNDKPFASAWMTIKVGDESRRIDLKRQDAQGLVWSLSEQDSPLANIRAEIRYELQVQDADGLSLESPIRGTIRIRPDRLPTAAIEVVHRVVLPTAEPVVEYRATDDYGLSQIALIAEIERFDERYDEGFDEAQAANPAAAGAAGFSDGLVAPAEEIPAERHRFELLTPGPILADRLPLAGQHAVSLSTLKLAKGDRLKLTLEVADYRGETQDGRPAGKSQQSESLVLEISDESGVLAAISEADERSEERLTDIIKRQLGIGETP
ncbi:MAG: hypothetical protein WD872_04420 [Pirellulaceae bacterium]